MVELTIRWTGEEAENVRLAGEFNNWQPQPMIRVSHLARALDKRPAPDFLKRCKELKLCRDYIDDISQMKPTELRKY